MSEHEKDPKMRGIVGLANVGNTCYMNAVLQAFRHCPEWTLFCTKGRVDEHIHDKESSSSKVLYAYKDILKSLWAGTGPAYVMPRGFFEQLRQVVTGTIYEDFIRRTPQDAHEFLVWLLDQMYMATQKKIHLTPSTNTLVGSMKHLAFEGWKDAFEKEYSPLTDLIFGMNRIQYTCSHCRAIHIRWETFNTFKITPKKNTEWLDCIKAEFTSEEIEGYDCESCKGKHKTTKQIEIWRLPKVLMFTIRRFTPMGTKDTTSIQYDGDTLNFSSLFAAESQEPKKNYILFGTVDHHGSMGGGHYTAQCLNPVWNNWHLYDDDSAHSIQKPILGSNTYIMFFRLQNRSPSKE